MRRLSVPFFLFPLALSAQTTVSGVTALGENGWDAYAAFNNASRTSFDFHDMAGAINGALTISTNGVADIASYDPKGTQLSSFVGATYRWQPGTQNVSLKLELTRTIFGFSFTVGTLVYDPTPATTGWNTTTVDGSTLWWFTGYKGTTDRYRTLSEWGSYVSSIGATISAIELGVGTSTPTGDYSGSIDSLQYSTLVNGSLVIRDVDFASPIPEPATTALALGICGLGVAAVARRRNQRR